MFIAICLVIFFSFHEILSLCNKIYVHNTKEESTVTKILTTDEFQQLKEKQQIILAGRYDKWYKWKTKWLFKEISKGTETILNDYYFSREHPEYDLAKIKYKVTKYKEDGKTVEYISDSKIIQVHSKNGWENK